jgi:hypothetical protein
MTGFRASIFLALALAALTGCGDETSPPPSPSDEVGFTIEGLPPSSPAAGYGHYELWISFYEPTAPRHEGGTISCGKFRIDSAGRVVGLDGQAITFAVTSLPSAQRDANGVPIWVWALDAFVTIEPAGDSDDVPTYPGFIGGPRVNGRAVLAAEYADALGDDFLGAGGAVLLATPSTSSASDEKKGAWFTETGATGPSLTLPGLADTAGTEGWIYEGWVAASGMAPVSLGRFLDPGRADDDGPLYGGDQPGYPFPGSDYPYGLLPGPDLAPSTVFVTIEPAGDQDGPGPFQALTVLWGEIPELWPEDSPLTLSGTAGAFPHGVVDIPKAP